jgi:hypothetical protein
MGVAIIFTIYDKKNKKHGCKWDIMSWTDPLSDFLLDVYSKMFLESFEQKFLKILNFLKEFSSHYYVMDHNKNCYKYFIVKKIEVHLQAFELFKNIGYNVFKMLFSIFHSLD